MKKSENITRGKNNPSFYFKVMLTKLEKKEYRELGKIIMNGSLDQVHKITSRYMELNQKKYNPFYKKL